MEFFPNRGQSVTLIDFSHFSSYANRKPLKKIQFYDAVLPGLRKEDLNRVKIFVFLYRLYE